MTSGGNSDHPARGEDGGEKALIRRARRGDERAFGALVQRYQDRVHRTAYRLVQNPDDAADVAQETFIKIWRRLPTMRAEVSFSSWVYRITVNTALDRIRQVSRVRHEDLDEDQLRVLSLDAYRAGPRESAREAEIRERVEGALAHLPARQKSVFVLRHFEGLKLREIGEALDCPVGTVKATLHHALAALRDRLVREGVVLPAQEKTDRSVGSPSYRRVDEQGSDKGCREP